MDVYDPAAEQQGDAHPGQDEAVTKVPWEQLSGVLEDFFMVQRVDERCRKHSQALKRRSTVSRSDNLHQDSRN